MKLVSLMLMLVLMGGCPATRSLDITGEFAWLEGSWRLLDAETPVYEVWSLEGEEWQGESYAAVQGMKVPTERIRLFKEGGRVIYAQQVKGRDGGNPVDFVLTAREEGRYTFSNPEYAFPSSITYVRVSDIAMKVQIQGIREGAFTEIWLEYVRKS